MLNSAFTISAPGKVILFGEHSVVYGKSAIAATIDKRTKIFFKFNTTNSLYLNLVAFDFKKEFPIDDIATKQTDNILTKDSSVLTLSTPEVIDHPWLVDVVNNDVNELGDTLTQPQILALSAVFYLLRAMFRATNLLIGAATITVESDLIIGAGTGSSASFAVCLSAFFYYYILSELNMHDGRTETKQTFSQQDKIIINKWAFLCEKIIHGTPSGMDNYVCTFGSVVQIYTNAETKQKEMKVVENSANLRVLLIYSGVPRSTAKMVNQVSKLRERIPVVTNKMFDVMEEIANCAISIIQKIGELRKNGADDSLIQKEIGLLEDLIDMNQGCLVGLGVSHNCLNKIIEITSSYSLHAKLTGAGGGGYAYTLVPCSFQDTVLTECVRSLVDNGFSVIDTTLGGPGVSIHL